MAFLPGRVTAVTWAAALVLLALPSYSGPVEPQHPIYAFLRRLDLLGVVPGGSSGLLPWDSRDIRAALATAESRRDALGPADRARLDLHLAEFDPERRRASTRLQVVDSDYTFFAGGDFWGAGYIQDSLPEGQRFLTGTAGPWLEAHFWDVLFLSSSAFIGMERSAVDRFTETYHPARGLPYNTSREGKAGIPQGVSTFDGYRAVAAFGKGPLRLDVGQDWNAFGPGHWQKMTLGTSGYFWVQDSLGPSDTVGYPGTDFPGRHRRGYRRPGETAPMPQLRMSFRGGKFAYAKVVATRDGVVPDQLATLVAHRLEWRPVSWLTLGGAELASIGGRVPGLMHWLPLVPLKILEHEVRDKDNLAMSFDAEVRRAGWGRFYGEFYFDDFSGPPLDFWGNKFAWTLGLEWVDPLKLPGVVRAEYAHVDPWVFTHHLAGRQHQHAGALYGSALPANSHAVWLQAATPLAATLEVSVQYSFQQRDLRSRGALFDVHLERESRTKAFLAEVPETRHQVLADATWNWRRHVEFKAGAGFLLVEDWKGEAGESLAAPTLLGELRLRY